MRGSLLVVATWLALCSSVLQAGEEPAAKPPVWLLKFQPLDVNSIVVERASGRGRLDWYMVYSIKNVGDQPRVCNARITAELLDSASPAVNDPILKELGGEAEKKVKAADILLPAVEEAVERKRGESLMGPADIMPLRRKTLRAKGQDRDQLLQELKKIQTIKPKEVRRGIATFGALDGDTDVVKIYVHNLTGTIGIKVEDGKRVLEEYVLVLTYRLPGDEIGMSEDKFEYVGRKWIKVRRELTAARKGSGEKQ